MTTPILKEKYDALKFVLAENLPQDLWSISSKKKGLVLVATKINSIPRDIVIPVDTIPTQFIKQISEEEGISSEKMDELIKKLRTNVGDAETEIETGVKKEVVKKK